MQTGPGIPTPANGIKIEAHRNGHHTMPGDNADHHLALTMTDEIKIKLISNHFREIMRIMGLNVNESNLKATPMNVAGMFVREIFSGLDPDNKPVISLAESRGSTNRMVIEKNISFSSHCEAYFIPIIGKVHVAYISRGSQVGISNLNKIIQYYSAKPQRQDRLTDEIATALKDILHTDDIAVIIDAINLYSTPGGLKDLNCSTLTSYYSGKLQNEDQKREFLLTVNQK